MDDGFYYIRHGSYNEIGPFPTAHRAYEEGVEGTFYSQDFILQEWRGGNIVREWRDLSLFA